MARVTLVVLAASCATSCALLRPAGDPVGRRRGQHDRDTRPQLSPAERAALERATRRLGRAQEHERAGRREQARQAYDEVVRLHPGTPQAARALVGLAGLRMGDGKVRAAREAAKAALERRGPHAAGARLLLAQVALRSDELDACCEQAGRTLLAAPTGPEQGMAHGLAAECRWRKGELGAALSALSMAYEHVDDPHRRAYLHGRAAQIALRRLGPAEAAALAARLETPLAARYLALRLALLAAKRGDRAALRKRLDQLGPWLQAEGQADLLAELRLRGAEGAASAPPSEVVALLPLSGPSRRVGSGVLDTLLVAAGAFDADADAGAPPLASADGAAAAKARARPSLRVVDTRSKPGRAAQLVEGLARQPGVLAAVGPFDVASARRAAAAAAAGGLPLLPVTVAERLGPEQGPVFRAFGSNVAEAERLATHAVAGLGIQRVAVLRPAVAYGEQLAAAFAAAVRGAGGEVVGEVAYDPKLSDPAEVMGRLERIPPFEALFVPDGAERVGLLAPHLASRGWWSTAYGQAPPAARGEKRRALQLLGTSAWYAPGLLVRAGRYLEGALVATAFVAEDPRPAVRSWVALFERAAGRRPTPVDAFAHDAFGLLEACAREEPRCGRAELMQRLRRPLDERGVTTLRSFDAAGEPLEPPHLVTVRGGRFELAVP